MTTADMPWRQGRNHRFDYLATRLAHWTPAVFLLGCALWQGASILVAVTGVGGVWWLTLPLALLASTPGLAIILLSTMIGSWHMYALCPVCARKVPADPQAAIAAKRRTLRALHWHAEHDRLLGRSQWVLAILMWIPWYGVGLAAFAVLVLSAALSQSLVLVHMPLQPWCPQCRGGWEDGGQPELAPDPDPVGEAVR